MPVEASASFDCARRNKRSSFRSHVPAHCVFAQRTAVQAGRIIKGSNLHPNEQVIQKFYEAFHARDAAGMNACCDPQIVFSDPAFGVLEGKKVLAMWEMLCSRAKDLRVNVSNIQADDRTGSAHWEAKYLFGRDRRPVHNVIEADFVFRDGKFVKHTDSFDMWRWTRMAVGGLGFFLGWSPLIKSAIQKSTRRQLEEYMQKRSA